MEHIFLPLHRIISYIKFLLKSSNQHGVHSPFVFGLVTKCFYDRKKYAAYETIRDYRKKLLRNKNTITITDFGAGSRIFSSDERKISAIAKNAGTTPKRARLLNRVVRYLEINNALELGTSLGISTAALAAGNKVQITSIEGCPATAEMAKKQFGKFGLNNIELKVGEFDTVIGNLGNEGIASVAEKLLRTQQKSSSKFQIPKTKFQIQNSNTQPTTENPQPIQGIASVAKTLLRNDHNPQQNSSSKFQAPNSNPQPTTHNPQPITHNSRPFDLIFIDGNHQKEATLNYFQKLLPSVHNDSVIIFDDIHWSREMEQAWEEIKAHPAVTVSIDTFFWGFVFIRKEQAKEHFTIRV